VINLLVLEYKVKTKKLQYLAIEESIKTTQFIRNKCLRFWMDAPKEAKIDRFALQLFSGK
jgi:putative transposase